MSDEIKKDDGKDKYVFRWKTFLIDAAIAIVIVLALQFIGACCYQGYQRFQEFADRFEQYEQDQQYQRQYDKRDRNGININIDGDKINPFRDRRADGLTIEEWIQANLPPKGQKDYQKVANVFYDIVKQLKKGNLKYDKDSFSYAVQQLQLAGSKKTWSKFYSGLTKQLANEKTSSKKDLIDVFTRIADTIANEAVEDEVIDEEEEIDEEIDEENDEEDAEDAAQTQKTAAVNETVMPEEKKNTPLENSAELKNAPAAPKPQTESKQNSSPNAGYNCQNGVCYPTGGR